MSRVAEIRKRLAAATKGAWAARCRHVSYSGGEWPRSEFLQWEVVGPEVPDGRGEFYQGDAEFIAHAPEDIDFLLSLLERYARAIVSGDIGPDLRNECRALLSDMGTGGEG